MHFKLKSNSIPEFCLVALLLLTHFFLAFTSFIQKSPTFDETVHETGGYCFWKLDDYRINPENGNFPQRWATIPLLFSRNINMPVFTKNPIIESNEWLTAYDFLFKRGNNPDRLFMLSRTMMVLLSIGLGLVVYFWSKKLFGIEGAALSLILYVFCPTILAHSRLVTSDIAAALGFIGSVWAIWRMLEKITITRVLVSSLWLSLLFLSKMSAFLIIPMYLIMIAVRLKFSSELEVHLPGRTLKFARQSEQLVAFLCGALVNALVIVFFIWMSFGFRYSMLNDDTGKREIMEKNWQMLLKGSGLPGKVIDFSRQHKLLPEAYLFGFQFVLRKSEIRYAYLNGEQNLTGWWYFFPYACLVKTPLPVLGIFALLLFLGVRRGRQLAHDELIARIYPLTPLIVLTTIFLIFAIASNMNIGHRHVLMLYPIGYILAGACWRLLKHTRFLPKLLFMLCCIWMIMESFWIWPHYLAYFNQLVGGPKNGYKHLVDSSLDWGQDLKGLGKWLRKNKLPGETEKNVYISYFGISSIDYYAPGLKKLPSYYGQEDDVPFELKGGIYCISATMLPCLYLPELQSPEMIDPTVTSKDELYANLEVEMAQLFAVVNDKEKLEAYMKEKGVRRVINRYRLYQLLRFEKLANFLKERKPVEEIGYSILIYRITDEDVEKALKVKFED